uniref:Saposin B-type domain-containing protein n=1 Tax=Brassica oleracea TaxID=3712 RepID=A0A3P6AII1_BRAOL|nr:unnamed protein product [Brassica oleracea]
MTCSQIPPLQKQADRYTQRFFTQVSLLKPHHICKSLNLCQPPLHSQGNCDACHDTVSQLLPKLKDPQTKLKIIRLLLKECKSLNNYEDKCKKMVFEYGPLMLADLENFLEKKDAHNDDGTRCLFRLRVKVQRASLSHSLTHWRDMGDEAEERLVCKLKHHLRIDSESKPECARTQVPRFGGFIRSPLEAKSRREGRIQKENGSLGLSAVGVAATLIIVILYFLLTK